MTSVSREVERLHKCLLADLSDMMDPNNPTYRNFICCLVSEILPQERLSEVQQNPSDVFLLLEEGGVLKIGEYQYLADALKASQYMNILDHLKNAEKHIARQMRKRSCSDGPMDGGSLNNAPAIIPQYDGVQASLFQQVQDQQTPQGLWQQQNQLLKIRTGQPLIPDQQFENMSNNTMQFQAQSLQALKPTVPLYYGAQTTCRSYPANMFQQQQTPQGLWQQQSQLLRYQAGQPLIPDQQYENMLNSTTQFQAQSFQAPRPTVVPLYYGAQTTCGSYPANMFQQQQTPQGLWQQQNQLLTYQTGQPLIPDQQNENMCNNTMEFQAQSLQASGRATGPMHPTGKESPKNIPSKITYNIGNVNSSNVVIGDNSDNTINVGSQKI